MRRAQFAALTMTLLLCASSCFAGQITFRNWTQDDKTIVLRESSSSLLLWSGSIAGGQTLSVGIDPATMPIEVSDDDDHILGVVTQDGGYWFNVGNPSIDYEANLTRRMVCVLVGVLLASMTSFAFRV